LIRSSYRTVAECAQKALSALKNEIREQFKGTAEELQRHFEEETNLVIPQDT
jgi:hypothetical protein